MGHDYEFESIVAASTVAPSGASLPISMMPVTNRPSASEVSLPNSVMTKATTFSAKKSNLRKIVPKAAMESINEAGEGKAYETKGGNRERMQRLLSQDDESKEQVTTHTRNLSLKKPILDDERSVLSLHLDGEAIHMPKINKLLSRWQEMSSPIETTPPNFQKSGKTVTINNKFNKPKPSYVRKNLVILDN